LNNLNYFFILIKINYKMNNNIINPVCGSDQQISNFSINKEKKIIESQQDVDSNKLTLEDIDCFFTLKTCTYFTVDAIMCIPCCCFCGGCCGRYSPCIFNLNPDESLNPGYERFFANCVVQTVASMIMPCTLCGCLFGCCGTCTPCARGIAQCVIGVESRSNDVIQTPPSITGMKR
jgi:hypothetical protein